MLQGFLEILLANRGAGMMEGGCEHVFEESHTRAEARRYGADRDAVAAGNDPYRLIGNQLFEKWREEEFADLEPNEG